MTAASIDFAASAERLSKTSPEMEELAAEFGPQKLWAGLKARGLDPEDFDLPASYQLDGRVPTHNVTHLKKKRGAVFEGLRAARTEELRGTLEEMKEREVEHFVKCGDGIRSVPPSEIQVDNLAGMGDYRAKAEKAMAKVKKEQQDKANRIVIDFLETKKRADDADAKMAALDKRLDDYAKEQQAFYQAKAKAFASKMERIQDSVKRTAQQRAEWEDEQEANRNKRFERAKATRTARYSTERLREKIEANKAFQKRVYDQAVALEEQRLNDLEYKAQCLEERMEEKRQRTEYEIEQRRQARKEKFDRRQVSIFNQHQDWVETKLDDHNKFMTHFEEACANGKSFMKERSKSTGSIAGKAREKWKSNYSTLTQKRNESAQALLDRHRRDAERVDQTNDMKLKCGTDVFTFREEKYGTWGTLQKSRMTEIRKQRNAEIQHNLFSCAEHKAKAAAQGAGEADKHRHRQQMFKDQLAFSDNAEEVFIKIKSEPDERRIAAQLEAIGFEMPKLAVEEKGGEEEESKPAF